MNKRMVWSRILCIIELTMIPIEVALVNLTLRVSGWFATALSLACSFLDSEADSWPSALSSARAATADSCTVLLC